MVFPQQNYIMEEQKKEQTDSLFFVEFTNFQFVFFLGWTRQRKPVPQLTADQKKYKKIKTKHAKNCNWSFLEVKNSLFLNVNVNVIMNVIAVFHGFQRFSHIARNPWKIRLFRLLLSLIYRSQTLQVRFPALNQYNPNQFFSIGDGFGLFIIFTPEQIAAAKKRRYV